MHKNCCPLSSCSLFFLQQNRRNKKQGQRASGKWLPCLMERQSSSRERRSFENMTLSTCTSLKGLTMYSTRQQSPPCCPSKALRMPFKMSQCCGLRSPHGKVCRGRGAPLAGQSATGKQRICQKSACPEICTWPGSGHKVRVVQQSV